jgi:hypothetical protein
MRHSRLRRTPAPAGGRKSSPVTEPRRRIAEECLESLRSSRRSARMPRSHRLHASGGLRDSRIRRCQLGESIVAFVEFIQLPLRSRGAQMRHALPRQGQRALRQNHDQPFHDAPIPVCEAAGVEPKKPAGQRAVYRGLRFLGVHPDHGPRPLSLLQESAQVCWSERAMQVHGWW